MHFLSSVTIRSDKCSCKAITGRYFNLSTNHISYTKSIGERQHPVIYACADDDYFMTCFYVVSYASYCLFTKQSFALGKEKVATV